jgi:hypothetical protein
VGGTDEDSQAHLSLAANSREWRGASTVGIGSWGSTERQTELRCPVFWTAVTTAATSPQMPTFTSICVSVSRASERFLVFGDQHGFREGVLGSSAVLVRFGKINLAAPMLIAC